MTCKDCIHSGLCYKENDYENFPDRCGSFISDKVLEERSQGEWIKIGEIGLAYKCNKCDEVSVIPENFCPNCGADMRVNNELKRVKGKGEEE